jgi:hypothetical protein
MVELDRKFLIKKVLKCESDLLNLFKKFLPYEKGFVLSNVENFQNELKDLTPQEIEVIKEHYPDLDELLLVQRVNLVRYIAFLLSILSYEVKLKELEYSERDNIKARLEDKRLLNIARAIKKESKRGRKPKKRKKLEEMKWEILKLREEGLGADSIIKYLWRAHRLKVSKPYLLKTLKEWEEKERAESPL